MAPVIEHQPQCSLPFSKTWRAVASYRSYWMLRAPPPSARQSRHAKQVTVIHARPTTSVNMRRILIACQLDYSHVVLAGGVHSVARPGNQWKTRACRQATSTVKDSINTRPLLNNECEMRARLQRQRCFKVSIVRGGHGWPVTLHGPATPIVCLTKQLSSKFLFQPRRL
jgi:hypothetical protein